MEFEQIITGAAGFVGGHLCHRLTTASSNAGIAALDLLPVNYKEIASSQTDIRSADLVSQLAGQWSSPVVVHLAAMAEVVMPFDQMHDLNTTNVQGTINLLEGFAPSRLVFASSSAVYGTVEDRAARPLPQEASAIGAYGVSKLMGEVICSEWAREHGSSVVALRFGNIVGPGCRGLIPYLVGHALKYPDGSEPTRLRGQGRIVRDYVPVEFAVESIIRATELELADGETAIFNVGSGRALTNGEVSQRVAAVLMERGYRLDLNFDAPIPRGESESVVLDVSDTTDRLGVPVPTSDQVGRAIEQATLGYLESMAQAAP